MIRAALSKLRRDDRGASVIELALTAPFLAAIVIGMSDLARAYSLKLQLEQAAQRTIEQIENQKAVNPAGYNSALTAEATSAMTDAGYSTGNTITADSWRECNTDTTHQTFVGDCPNTTDTTTRYVSISISHDYTPFFPSRAWPSANSDGTITLNGYAEVRIQ
jgi:Flp pilus assembly protein TadG